MFKLIVFTIFLLSFYYHISHATTTTTDSCLKGQYFTVGANCENFDCFDFYSKNMDKMELIPGNFKCHDISQDCVCARVANSHTFELYTKISNGDFEKVSSENENSNHMMVLARLPVQGGMFKLARLPSKRIPDTGMMKLARLPVKRQPDGMMDLARLPVKRRTPKSMMDLARLPVKRRTAKSMMDLARLPEKRMPAGNMMNLARLPL